VDQARLRQKGREKFGDDASRMLFVDEALQQASGRSIARYRAGRFERYSYVADLGCGIGGDALALSEVAEDLLGLDLDPVRLLFAEHNLRVAGGGATTTLDCADWTGYPFPSAIQAAFADPGRRVEGRRVFSLRDIEPPVDRILEVQRRVPDLGVKVMPGVPDEEVPEECEVEFISESGTLKEAVLWFGELREGPARVATRRCLYVNRKQSGKAISARGAGA
jgi:SAM-dependent methyltransferase